MMADVGVEFGVGGRRRRRECSGVSVGREMGIRDSPLGLKLRH